MRCFEIDSCFRDLMGVRRELEDGQHEDLPEVEEVVEERRWWRERGFK
jgi:hypothetical protein